MTLFIEKTLQYYEISNIFSPNNIILKRCKFSTFAPGKENQTKLIMIRIGIDIGSTTAKVVALDEAGNMLFSKYERHNANANDVVVSVLEKLMTACGDADASVRLTGSVGMGFSEKHSLPFVQEVVAATKAVMKRHPETSSLIDIGGEDAKVVFFRNGRAADLRMNGNCAGGTGAFIDQMAVLLNVSIDELDSLATSATHTYPIASRCGVFCKTDIQNLIAKNVSRADIAASILHAVAVQTVVTLAHGCEITPPVLMCGGPLTFIPALRKAFTDYLGISEDDIILPENGTLLPATGAALAEVDGEKPLRLSAIIARLRNSTVSRNDLHNTLQPIFNGDRDYSEWQKRMSRHAVAHSKLHNGWQDAFIGIDSGSTTTKIVVTDNDSNIIYSYYNANNGNPIEAVEKGLDGLRKACAESGTELNIKGSCSTGYGEDLVKAAFQLDSGIVETMAHYMAAHYLDPDVSFILDIGGQDMKAIFVTGGVIDRIEINEACSSGCGSFIETFAKTLGYTAHEFSSEACRADAPCDLGTRCTVFMNSKVKQALREGASIADIAAGLAYSVVKNCLYKVLKLRDVSQLGSHIVVQGGTMRNDAVVRALELLTGAEVTRCDTPELMGAYGCALFARRGSHRGTSLDDMMAKAGYTSRTLHCKGCDNQCLVMRYRFDNGHEYFSGNRCEKVFTNSGGDRPQKGLNAYEKKNRLLFDRDPLKGRPATTIGIPRCLNMYEDYPFWHTLFTNCGMEVRLSSHSEFSSYEQSACMVMSDNICFPAKLAHSHIQDLIDSRVDRIFMPFVVYERQDGGQNSYNCPIVTGYAEVVKGVQGGNIPIDSPTISFKDKKLLFRQCCEYLATLGVDDKTASRAFSLAVAAQDAYTRDITAYCEHVYRKAREKGAMTILLAGRPYHADMLIQHKVSDMLADMGVYVITDDIVRGRKAAADDAHYLPQWAYPNRILEAARWSADRKDVEFVEMTSFGCGPDAFLTDEVRDLLMRHGKTLTLLKLDDINNVGSMKLRVRSLMESLKIAKDRAKDGKKTTEFKTTSEFDAACRGRKIIVPFFTPFISPLIPAIMRVAGYDVDNLPLSDTESCEWGLRYANNEVCYPATLIVGDIIKAFKSGKYDPAKTAVAMTQTGGQCRASSYVQLIKKALVDAGYAEVPVVAFTFGGSMGNRQPGFRVNWMKMLPIALYAVLYSDCISKFYYASVVREKQPGQAARLRDLYLEAGESLIVEGRHDDLVSYLGMAAAEFNRICRDTECPKVCVVGEIFLKFNPFAQKSVTDWLISQGVEIVPPLLLDFFMQSFVNRRADEAAHLRRRSVADFAYTLAYKRIRKHIDRVNRAASAFSRFTPFADIFAEAEEARKVITLSAQFGEGWLLPAEIMSCARQGVRSVVSLQPFGCIANHIVSKGVEKKIKAFFPDMNILSLDFDSGVSDVNITNRLLLFIDNLKEGNAAPANR